jgi:predicted RNase H-like nuclease (RuvC/YqgF family)
MTKVNEVTIESLRERIQNLSAKVSGFREGIKEIEQGIEKLEAQNESAFAEYQTLLRQGEPEKANERLKMIKPTKAKIEDLKREIKDRESVVEEFKKEHDKLQTDVSSYRVSCQQLVKEAELKDQSAAVLAQQVVSFRLSLSA